MKAEDFHWMMSVEGRRSISGGLSPYRKGAAIAALASNSVIVPYITRGTWECVHDWGAPSCPTELTIEILPPIPTAGIADKDELMNKICGTAEKYLGQRPVIYLTKK
jgi:1-acyl-sn-glycerol-3-phosphate acyltransferase